MIELSPSIPDIVESQIPDSINVPENAKFIALLRHYYDWLTQKGQPTEFIHNLLEYKDIDLTNESFRQHLAASLYHAIPEYSKANRTLITKHITKFLRAKGSLESFVFIMNAIYGEDIEMEWNSGKLFRASDNEYSRTATVAVESTAPWAFVENSQIFQSTPHPASAVIESCVTTTHNGKIINWLKLNHTSIIGHFVPGGKVEVLHNTVDRTGYFEEEYYTPIKLSNHIIEFKATVEENRPYEGLVIKQLGSDFRAVVSSFLGRKSAGSSNRIKLLLTNETGTFGTGDIYIFPATLEPYIYTKNDMEFGFVSKSIVDVDIVNGGSLYTAGDIVKFIQGDGTGVEGFVSETKTGAITSIDIIKKGYGYSVGDELISLDAATSGSGLKAVVSSIDGIGGAISATSELNAISILSSGTGYAVGDIVELVGGVLDAGSPPAQLQVSSVVSTWAFKGINITNSGFGYPLYTKIELINPTTLTPISGFSATPSFNSFGGISSIAINTYPTIADTNLMIIANGYGANYTANITAGAITGFTQVAVGVNYKDPIVEVFGDGYGCVAVPNVTNGQVTSITLVRGGVGYTTATVVIRERYGWSFAASSVVNNQATGTGEVTGLTIIKGGNYISLPTCFNHKPKTITGSGSNLELNIDFRLLSAKIDNAGQYYHGVNVSVSGTGTGASFYPELVDGVLTSASFLKGSGGTGYTYADVFVTGGEGFVGVANIVGGAVDSITVLNGGKDYSLLSLVTIVGDGNGANYSISGVDNGVLAAVNVINGGQDYYYGTTMSAPTTQPGAIPATLTPVIDNGRIAYVIVSAGNSGYVSSDLANITVSAGTAPVISATASGTGKLVDYTQIRRGSGYWSQSEVTPLSLSVSDGNGALLIPVLTSAGSFERVDVLDGGNGYLTTSTITITGGVGVGAVLTPVVLNGRIMSVTITTPGSGYKYGTSAFIIGDGNGAAITPLVETGITSAEVIAGGTGYDDTTTISITDASGTGAEIRPIISNGSIVSLEIINKGVGYVNPSITAVGVGINAQLTAKADRFIKSLQIDNAGAGYTYADIVILGDGTEEADYTLIFDKLGSIDIASVSVAGSGIVSTPIVTVSDNSGYGAVSGVAIKDNGNGYNKLPPIYLADKYDTFGNLIASGTKFSCFGTNVGAVAKVSFTNNGAAYENPAFPVFPIVAKMSKIAPFRKGETVTVQQQDEIVTAKVVDYDFENNLIKLDAASNIFYLASELDAWLITEDGTPLIDMMSSSLAVGDKITGEKSGASAVISSISRAHGWSVVGGSAFSNYKFETETGLLNSRNSIIADNNRYQDYAYVIRAGIVLKDYEKLLKATVHPAGYALFGDLVTSSYVISNILNEIGYNKLITTILLTSIYALYQDGNSEWNDTPTFFGDFTKFNFTFMPIELIANSTIENISDMVYMNYNEYITSPIVSGDLLNWTKVNNPQVIFGTSETPLGQMAMYRIGDTANGTFANVTKQLVGVAGNTITLELFVRKQSNPITHPRFEIAETLTKSYIDLNTMTGSYVGVGVMDVIDLSDWWFVRIGKTLTGTSYSINLYPAADVVGNLGNISNVAIGSLQVSKPVIKNITGLTPIETKLRAINSKYNPMMFYLNEAETVITVV